MDGLEDLNKSIEELSGELAELIKEYSIIDPEVIKKIREIDRLTTRYHELLSKEH